MQEFATRKAIAQGMGLRLLNCLLRKYRMAVRIMKLTAIILLGACLQLSARGISQTITLSLKDAPLQKVFKEIERQTDYTFFYSWNRLEQAKKVTIKVSNLPIDQVLALCFSGQPFNYSISGKTITITAKKKESTDKESRSIETSISNKDVNGVITDENGSPAQGVNVTVKGTGNGTSTNRKGEFFLKGVDESAYLVITSVGYDKVEVPIRNKDFISLQLKVAVGNLDEMQVIAYGTTSKRFNTGNVATIKSSDIEKRPIQNPLLALQGRVPGIDITQLTGMPGGGVTVRIQGRNSINSGLEPLIVIDGVPFSPKLLNSSMEFIVQGGSPLNYINPSDIESIDILKDADATAIYGSRAANGAILITTKKGKAGKMKLGVNLQQGWAKVGRKVDMMNTRQYLDMRYEAYKNDGIDISTLTPNSRTYDITLWDTTRYADWQEELIGGTALYTNLSTSISGGTPNLQYFIGGTYNRQTTVFPGDFDDKKGSLHFNTSATSLNQKFKVQLSGNYMYDRNHLLSDDLTEKAILFAPVAPPLYNPDGSLNWAPNASGSSTWENPLVYTLSNEYNNTTKNLIANLNLSYKIFTGLEIATSFGYTNTQTNLFTPRRLEHYRPEQRATSMRSTINGDRNMISWIVEPQIQYTKKISRGKLQALVGGTIQKNSAEVLSVYGVGYSSDILMKTLTAAPIVGVNAAAFSESKFNALFGRVNYTWQDKYILNLTARRDGSSKFGDANKFHNFGSIGLGWIFSEERFIRDKIPVLSFGKLRGSYGTTGNDQIGDFEHLSLYGIDRPGILYQNDIGLSPYKIPNPHLQWEETRKLQGGIDLGFFNDRILLDVTYAINRSTNQLVSYILPSTTGFTGITQNLPAVIRNTSLELALNTINLKNKNFQWTSNFNITVPRNKLLSFPGIENTVYSRGDLGVIVGEPLGVQKAYPFAGVDPTTGNYQVFDKDGHLTTTPNDVNDRTILINPAKKYYGGMQQSIRYKSFQLDALFQFVRQLAPNDMYYFNGNQSISPGNFAGPSVNQPATVLNRWQKPGDMAPFGRYTSIRSGLDLSPVYLGNIWYSYDASYIRLKNVSLSWHLPIKWTQKVKMNDFQFYFRGENLATISKYSGLDPENASISSLPPLRVMTVGIQAEF